MAKKLKALAVISLATFSGFAACLAGQLQVVPQSKPYNVSTNQIAYQVWLIVSKVFHPYEEEKGQWPDNF